MRKNATMKAVVVALALMAGAPAVQAQSTQDMASAVYDEPDALPFDEDVLQPGDYRWLAPREADSWAEVLVVVDLAAQRAQVYRNGQRIAVSTISSGKPGKETPTGVFPILGKKAMHHSNRYDNAPMPFMQRLTWDGVALHAGHIPGHPASHGCIRLPKAFARELFEITRRGQTVLVSDDSSMEGLRRVGATDAHLQMMGAPTSSWSSTMYDAAARGDEYATQ